MSSWQGFYSTSQVSRLAGIPRRTLYDWKSKGIIGPSVHILNEAGDIVDEGYSYRDLAITKLLRALRNKQLNLRSVVKSLYHLIERFGLPNSPEWNNAHVYIINKDVFAQKPDEWETTVGTRGGQKAEMKVLGELFEEEAAIVVPKRFDTFVEINLDVMEGQPVIRDTRVPTSILATMSDQGVSLSDLVELYAPIPRLTIEKAIEFEKSLDETIAPAT
jgi:uncharacterized protein (DUF433 family)